MQMQQGAELEEEFETLGMWKQQHVEWNTEAQNEAQ